MPAERTRKHMGRAGVGPEVVTQVLGLVSPSGGQLSEEQFCLGMALIARATKGGKPPEQLPHRLGLGLGPTYPHPHPYP